MSDKFRTTFTIPVTFANGEQPTGTKLNSISTQSRNGLAVIERAIGDLWNQSGDSVTSSYPNRISNIARALGDQALLNSKLPLPDFTGTSSVRIRQSITGFLGKAEIPLDFKPIADSTINASVALLKNDIGGGSFYSGTPSVLRTDVDSDTEWFLDTARGKIGLGRPLHATQTATYIEYNVLAADFASDSANSSSFSMIPHQSQLDWKGLKISSISANKYFLTLPFRRPEASPSGLGKISTGTNNSAVIGTPSIKYYFGPETSGYAFTSGVSNVRFFRYTLPQIVQDMFVTPVAGTIIPSGTLYLWDTVTNTIIEGVTFKIPESPMALFGSQVAFVVQAEGVTLDQVFSGFTSSDSTEAVADYQSRFALICVGQSVAQAVEQLRQELAEGDAGLGFRRKFSHRDLIETQPMAGTGHATNFPPSFVTGDDHVYLLSRLGSQDSASITTHRDRYNNGILGDLLMLSSNSSTNYQNLSAVSNYIYFGSNSSISPRVRGNPTAFTTAAAGVAQNILDISNASLRVNTGIIGLGSSTYGIAMVTNNLAVVDNTGAITGKVFGQRILLNATTEVLSTFAGTVDGTRYIDIDATSNNNIEFKGGDFTIASFDGQPSDLVIGGNVSGTDLVLLDNVIKFNANSGGGNFEFFPATDIFQFSIGSNVSDSIIAGGSLRLLDRSIEFGGLVSGSDDSLTFVDTNSPADIANTYTFQADGSVDTARVEAGKLRATAGIIGLNDDDTYSFELDDTADAVSFTKGSSVNAAAVQAMNLPKAWGVIQVVDGGAVTILDSWKIDSVSYTSGTAEIRVLLDNDVEMSDENYPVMLTIEYNAVGHAATNVVTPRTNLSAYIQRTTKTTSSFDIVVVRARAAFEGDGNTQVDLDNTGLTDDLIINFTVFGRLV